MLNLLGHQTLHVRRDKQQRSEVSRLLTRKDVGSVRAVLVDAAYKGTGERFREMGKTLEALARQWLGGENAARKESWVLRRVAGRCGARIGWT